MLLHRSCIQSTFLPLIHLQDCICEMSLVCKICNFFHVTEFLQDGHWEDAGEGATGLLKKTKSLINFNLEFN